MGSTLAAVGLAGLLAAAAFDAGAPGSITMAWIPLLSVMLLPPCLYGLPRDRRRKLQQVLLPLLGILLIMAIYVANPTHRWEDGAGLVPLAHVPWLPGAVSGMAAWSSWTYALSLVAVFLLGLSLDGKAFGWLMAAMLAGAAWMAAFAIHQRLLPQPFNVYPYTGLFVSENHYAAFANLMLPAALASGLRCQYRAAQTGAQSSAAGLCYLAAGLLAASVLLTGSRTGVALLLFTALGWGFLLWRLRRVDVPIPVAGTRWLMPSCTLLAAGSLAAVIVVRLRMSGLMLDEWTFRSRVLLDTVDMWHARPWWGIGPGCFHVAFPYYQSEVLQGTYIAHAHCEPLQFAAEFGWIGLAAVILLFLAAVGLARRVPQTGHDIPSPALLEAQAFALALTGVFLHGLVDFPFRAPLLGWVAVLWLSRLCTSAGVVPKHAPNRKRHPA